VNNRLSICILLCLAILASGQAAAQGTYGTKVLAGDPDVGLPLSNFATIGLGVAWPPDPAGQQSFWISYWDLNANGLYDDQDVAYLQFGSTNLFPPAQRIARANNIRLTGWSIYPAGSYVKAGDSDMGQQLNTVPPAVYALPSAPAVGFYYLNVAGGAGYDLGDPVYLKALSPMPPLTLSTNDVRITANGAFPAGSRVSLADPDAGLPLTPFKLASAVPPVKNAVGGPTNTVPVTNIASLMFFNTNGNILSVPAGSAIFDDGDVVYLHVGVGGPGSAVGPGDIRLF